MKLFLYEVVIGKVINNYVMSDFSLCIVDNIYEESPVSAQEECTILSPLIPEISSGDVCKL